MNVTTINVGQEKARELALLYREHRSAMTPEDQAIWRAYREIARGRVVIRALASIAAAGLNEQGVPKLAIVRADYPAVYCRVSHVRPGTTFTPMRRVAHRGRAELWECGGTTKRWNVSALEGSKYTSGHALAPPIPVHLRPRTELDAYHILWEAEWGPIPPTDPMLLRHIVGDMWVVCAARDLTEVERAAMAMRVSA